MEKRELILALSDDFKNFCDDLCLDTTDMETTCGEITKKLNSCYYGLANEKAEHIYIVGSVGRKTAIVKTSDLDVIFDLPISMYSKYNAYESNGQSALLQEVKEVLKERYPTTDIKGDGQVISIEFISFTVELVPAFKQSDDTFKYPDTHNGGSWKYTDPIAEQDECVFCNVSSCSHYYRFCRMIRKWKSNCGVAIGGLLIDTLVYNHFVDQNYYTDKTYYDYFDMLKYLFCYFKERNKNQSYWVAVGSNQFVYNKDNGSFIGKADKAYKKFCDCDTDEKKYDAFIYVFGSLFPNTTTPVKSSYIHSDRNSDDTEEFIENSVPIDIKYSVKIDCRVTQNGFRDFLLSIFLREGGFLQHNKSLEFFIASNNVPCPYQIWWKVRNVGSEAKRKNQIRGQIITSNSDKQREHTSFYGPHFVECYIIKNGVCVARDRIDVPIGST
ncbi:MAG: hypothetical protein LBL65_05945 [Campylobacteraceae bacterium]|jgi:hypothetical protein|nr:hypothetical protein [Campylobacteraceae bacterium]